MKKFELCYSIDNNTILIPDLLDIQQPDFTFDYTTSLNFKVQYDFLPKSVMPRSIVKMHKNIKNDYVWRTGVVLYDRDFRTSAVIRSDEDAKKVDIYVNGQRKRDFFAVILYNLREINTSFEKINATELVPMPDNPGVAVSYEHLLRLERRGIDTYLPDGSEKEYNVIDLLGSIYSKTRTEEEMVALLEKIRDKNDNEETLVKKADDILVARPTIFGIGIDLKALVKSMFQKDKPRTKTTPSTKRRPIQRKKVVKKKKR